MDIDLSVLRMMEREKEIPFDELVQIIEQAILMAYLKHTNPGQHGHTNPNGARAHLDRGRRRCPGRTRRAGRLRGAWCRRACPSPSPR